MSNKDKSNFLKDSVKKATSLEVESDPVANKRYGATRDPRDIWDSVCASKAVVEKIKNGIGVVAELLPVVGAIIFSYSGFDMVQNYLGNFGIKDSAISLVFTTALLLVFGVLMLFVGRYAREAIEKFHQLSITWGDEFGIVMSIFSVVVTTIIFVFMINDSLDSFIGWGIFIIITIMVIVGIAYDAFNKTSKTIVIFFVVLASGFNIAIAQIDVYLDGHRGASIIAYQDKKEMDKDPISVVLQTKIAGEQSQINSMKSDIEHQRYRQSIGVTNSYNTLLIQQQALQASLNKDTSDLRDNISILKDESTDKQENFIMGMSGISYGVMMLFNIVVLISHLIKYVYLNREVMANLKDESDKKEEEETQKALAKESENAQVSNPLVPKVDLSKNDIFAEPKPQVAQKERVEENQISQEEEKNLTSDELDLIEKVVRFSQSVDIKDRWVTIGDKKYLVKPSLAKMAMGILDKNGNAFYSQAKIQSTIKKAKDIGVMNVFESKNASAPSYFQDIAKSA